MTPDQLLIKIKALDLLIDEVMADITENETLASMDESWDADKCSSLLQDYLETLAATLKKGA
jgi:hypothetical protein